MSDHVVIGDIRPRIQYTADGTQTQFTYPFPIFAAADLKVYLGEALQTSGYSVAGAGQSAGGSVTFAAAPSNGAKVTLVRAIVIARTSDFQEGGAFRAKTINDELDRQTAFVQEAAERIERALVAAPTETAAPLVLPPPAERANALLGFDAAGMPVAVAGTPGDVMISSAMAPVVEAASLAAARAAFGMGAGATAAKASQAAAEAGSDDADYMTALKSKQTIKVLGCPAATLIPGGRLAFDSGVPVPTSDKTAQTAIKWVPKNHAYTKLWDGSEWRAYAQGETTLNLDSDSGHAGYHQSGKNFDLFAFLDAGAVKKGTGPAWTSDTARGTGAGTTELEYRDGILVNKVAITLRFGTASGNTVALDAGKALYLGTFRASANGQMEDSVAKRFAWNTYNRVARTMRVQELTDSWTYTTAVVRQARASTANQLDFVRGLDEDELSALAHAFCANSIAGTITIVGLGLDATNSIALGFASQIEQPSNDNQVMHIASYRGQPGLGRHYVSWNEYSVAAGTTTWYGDNGLSPMSGLEGMIWA